MLNTESVSVYSSASNFSRIVMVTFAFIKMIYLRTFVTSEQILFNLYQIYIL